MRVDIARGKVVGGESMNDIKTTEAEEYREGVMIVPEEKKRNLVSDGKRAGSAMRGWSVRRLKRKAYELEEREEALRGARMELKEEMAEMMKKVLKRVDAMLGLPEGKIAHRDVIALCKLVAEYTVDIPCGGSGQTVANRNTVNVLAVGGGEAVGEAQKVLEKMRWARRVEDTNQ